jgi:hypothetical protein
VTAAPTDDLGEPVPLAGRPTRVVSLVPSITEAVAVSVPRVLVGATDYCTHPAELDVARGRRPLASISLSTVDTSVHQSVHQLAPNSASRALSAPSGVIKSPGDVLLPGEMTDS